MGSDTSHAGGVRDTGGHSATHLVTNQPPPLVDYNIYEVDVVLRESFEREAAAMGGGGEGANDEILSIGEIAGSAQAQMWAQQANENTPKLRSHDRFGHRIDMVEYHPAYHELMRTACEHGLHAAPWVDSEPAAHLRRAAKVISWYQADPGHVCPISMTYSSIPALRHEPELARHVEPRLTSRDYDPTYGPMDAKTGATAGMGMTEKQGGSDVRANSTIATRSSVEGGYHLRGHKWFVSAPMSDGFLMLAQAPEGLGCFWVPRWKPDGERNPFAIQRLKDKLGDRSNASSEVELDGTWGQLVGEEGRGVRTIIEMVNHTRLDCSLGSASNMRAATAQAIWHCAHRRAFGRDLIDQPLMQNVLADLALESEAATTAVMRLARTFDHPDDEREQLLARILLPVIKYWTCKRAPQHVVEALECFGGNGFIEEGPMPRLLRQSPVNGVWEGSGNVICLDMLRAIARSPESYEVFCDEVRRYSEGDVQIAARLDKIALWLTDLDVVEWRARRIVEDMALVFQAALLHAVAPTYVSDAFIHTRLGGEPARAFGTLPLGVEAKAIIGRAQPVT